MNEYFFYTTEGYTEGSNKDYPVEHCQLLGTAFGKNPSKALGTLLKENSWIAEAGFSTEKVSYRLLAPSN